MNARPIRIGVVGVSLAHDEWLRLRQQGIGGSDAPAIAGASQWSSPMSVYLDKIGATPAKQSNEAMYWGTKLEEAVTKEFELENAVTIRSRQHLYRSRTHPFMLATIDGRYRDEEKRMTLYEGKTTSTFNGESWSEEPPLHVYVQVQHNMAVMGYHACGVACLIGGQHYVSYRVRRDENFIKRLIKREQEFYENNMLRQEPPAIDGSPSSTDAVGLLFSTSDGTEIGPMPNPEKAQELVDAYLVGQAESKRIEIEMAAAANGLKMMLGEAEAGSVGSYRVSWANRVRRSIDAKAMSAAHPKLAKKFTKEARYRVFSVKEMKDRD